MPSGTSGLDGTSITLAQSTGLVDPGYHFAGWNDGSATFAAAASYSLSSNGSPITLTAQWAANATDDVTFDSEGGSAVGPLSGLDGQTLTLPGAPTYAGHSFAGWFTAPSGGSALSSPYTLSGTLTLYAHWTNSASQVPASGDPQLSDAFTILSAGARSKGSIVVVVQLPGPGTVDLLGTHADVTGAIAAMLEPGGHRFAWGRDTVNVTAAGKITITLNPDGKGKELLARHHHHGWALNITVWVTYTPTGGHARSEEVYVRVLKAKKQ